MENEVASSSSSTCDNNLEEMEVEKEEEVRAKRVRKGVEKLNYDKESVEKEEWSVKSGKGELLSGMEGVCLQISRLKANDVLLKTMHTMFFQRQGKKTTLRKNLRSFSGFPEEGEDLKRVQEKARAKLAKLPIPQVKRLMDTLLIERSGNSFEDGKVTKDGLVDRVIEWITKPTEPTRKAPESLRKKAKKKPKKKKKKAKKPERTGPKKGLSAYMFFCKAKRKEVAAANPDLKAVDILKKMGAIWNAFSDEEKKPYNDLAAQDKERYQRELAEAPAAKKKTKKKRKSPSKAPAAKKKRKKAVVVESDDDSSSDDDMPFAQIEIKAKLTAILDDPDLDKTTLGMKSLRKMLSKKMNGADMKPHKAFIKKIVMEKLA